MKKIISSTLFAITLMSITHCSPQKKIINREVEHSQHGKMLLGLQSLDQFEKEPFSVWYNREKEEYTLDKVGIEELKTLKLQQYTITAFIGTWCPDSHRELPRMIRILEAIQYPKNKLKIIATNTQKQSPTGEDVLQNIRRVPTFILHKNGAEIGRIVEFPESGYLERDLVQIIRNYNAPKMNRHAEK